MPITRAVLSCGDGRLDEYLEGKYNNGQTVFIRNPGANAILAIPAFEQLVRNHPELREVVVAPHTDCGAMGLSAQEDPETTDGIKTAFTSQFRDNAGKALFKNRDDLEMKVNPHLQVTELENFFRSRKLDVTVLDPDVIDVHALESQGLIAPHKGGKVLLIADVSATGYSEFLATLNADLRSTSVPKERGERSISDMYMLQTALTGEIDRQLVPDPLTVLQAQIFIRHVGTETVRFISENRKQFEALTMLSSQLRSEGLITRKPVILEQKGRRVAR